ncbi:hypothetical protein RKD49_001502 [Streptomyces glaucescens]
MRGLGGRPWGLRPQTPIGLNGLVLERRTG